MNPTPIDPTQKITPTTKSTAEQAQNTTNSSSRAFVDHADRQQTRAQKLEHIRQQIAQGAYLVDAEELAKTLIDGGFLG